MSFMILQRRLCNRKKVQTTNTGGSRKQITTGSIVSSIVTLKLYLKFSCSIEKSFFSNLKRKALSSNFDHYNSQFLRKLEGNRIILTVPAWRGLNSIRQDIALT